MGKKNYNIHDKLLRNGRARLIGKRGAASRRRGAFRYIEY
jgi:hypothetical protein